MLIVRELQIGLVEAKLRSEFADVNARVQAEDWVDVLERVNAYLESVVWFPESRYKRELRLFLTSGCSYRKTARKCGVSVKWLHTAVEHGDEVLRRRGWDSVISAVRNGDIRGVERSFVDVTRDCANVFEYVTRHRYKPVCHDEVDLRTCTNELDVLRRALSFEDDMWGLDRDKVEHLLHLLQDSKLDLWVRQYLFQSLEGHWTSEHALDVLVTQYGLNGLMSPRKG
jgi:hypothetical protein